MNMQEVSEALEILEGWGSRQPVVDAKNRGIWRKVLGKISRENFDETCADLYAKLRGAPPTLYDFGTELGSARVHRRSTAEELAATRARQAWLDEAEPDDPVWLREMVAAVKANDPEAVGELIAERVPELEEPE